MPKQGKKRTIAQFAELVATDLQKLVRLKASDENGHCQCVTCGVIKHYKEMQGGHFIQRGKTATKLIEENIHPQCVSCNQWKMHKERDTETYLKYRDYMVDMYGEEFVEELREKAREVKKWKRWELEDMRKEIRQQIKELESAKL